jgi:CHASE2 domain-containing sensor protein
MIRRFLISLLFLNALCAVAGGVSLVAGIIEMPAEWLIETPFETYVVPGLVLAAVVGGSSLGAAIALQREMRRAPEYAVWAGGILVGWILSEALILLQFQWLQAIFGLLGLAIVGHAVWLASNKEEGRRSAAKT